MLEKSKSYASDFVLVVSHQFWWFPLAGIHTRVETTFLVSHAINESKEKVYALIRIDSPRVSTITTIGRRICWERESFRKLQFGTRSARLCFFFVASWYWPFDWECETMRLEKRRCAGVCNFYYLRRRWNRCARVSVWSKQGAKRRAWG